MLQYIGFRRAEPDDLPAIEALLREENLPADGLRPAEFIVAMHEKDNRILGCGRIHEEQGASELADLVVGADVRAQGIGRFLAQRILERRREPIYLLTWRHDMPFFAGLGFRAAAAEETPGWLRAKCDRILGSIPDADLAFGVRDASVVSF